MNNPDFISISALNLKIRMQNETQKRVIICPKCNHVHHAIICPICKEPVKLS